MSDLISRQEVIKRIEELPNSPNGYSATYDKASIIMAIEDVEPFEPIIHAHWIADERYCEYTCSHCGDAWRGDFDLDPYDDHFYYCPNCGAKMDEEVS